MRAQKSVPITTNATTSIGRAGAVLTGIVVNTAGTGSTIAFYDAPFGTTSTSGLTALFTLSTASAGIQIVEFQATQGLIAVTAGSGAANVSVLFNDGSARS